MDVTQVSVSGMRRHTHAIYVASWLRRVLDGSDTSIELLDLDAAPAPSSGLTDQLVAFLDAPDRVKVIEHHRPHGPHQYVAVGAPGVKPWLHLRRTRPGRLTTVVVDEGLGSHSTWRVRRSALRREGTPEPRATVRASAVAAARRLLTDERWHLYEHHAHGWHVNERIAAEFRRHRPAHGTGTRDPTEDVVYLSQPWVDFGVVPAVDHLAHLHDVERVVSDAGLHLRLRLHPAEDRERYGGFDVMPPSGPAELDPGTVGCRLVLGDCSTALLNLSTVLDVPSRRILPRSGFPVPLSEAQQSLFDAFLPPALTIDALVDELARTR